jgi:hypothetical protein
MGVIIINPYSQISGASPSPPSGLYSEDNVGNGTSNFGDSKVTLTDSIYGVQHDRALDGKPIEVRAGFTSTFEFNGQMTGTATSISWTVNTIDNFAGLVTGITPNTGTAINFAPVFSINPSGNPGDMAIFEVDFTAVNSAGSGNVVFDVVLILP